MSVCVCEKPIPCTDSATCVKCGKACLAAIKPQIIPVCPFDALLHHRRRRYFARTN